MSETPKLYCGNSENLPENYDDFGTRYDCLKKGVGVGIYKVPMSKIKKARRKLTLEELKMIANILQLNADDEQSRNNMIDSIIASIYAKYII